MDLTRSFAFNYLHSSCQQLMNEKVFFNHFRLIFHSWLPTKGAFNCDASSANMAELADSSGEFIDSRGVWWRTLHTKSLVEKPEAHKRDFPKLIKLKSKTLSPPSSASSAKMMQSGGKSNQNYICHFSSTSPKSNMCSSLSKTFNSKFSPRNLLHHRFRFISLFTPHRKPSAKREMGSNDV